MDTVSKYLDAIGWRGSLNDADAVLRRFGDSDSLATIQLEVSERVVEAALGLEFSAPGVLDGGADRWIDVFRRLDADGLCTLERREAAMKWPQMHRQPLKPGGWPCTIRQDLSHVKITVRPGQPLRAKAYLSVVPSFSLFGPR
jgi:hypothetical protein